MEKAKNQLMGVVRENTQHLVRLNDLLTSQHSLETRLNARQKSLVCHNSTHHYCLAPPTSSLVFYMAQRGEVGGGRGGEEEEEIERLEQLTVLQAHEIAALQQEIRALSTKGGKILPPSQPPVGPPPPGVSPII